ncbi:MAG: MFS transporter [Bacilli bacterium]|nr:MFS transporter [Bacilli bacterium]
MESADEIKLSSKREIALIIFCFLAYTISYITRYSYNANVNQIIEYYSIDKAQFGLVGTLFFAAYGTGQFINAFLCRKYNKRIIIPIALTISSALNLVLFFQPPFVIYKYLWLINGLTLSMLWPTLLQILAEHISTKNMKFSVIIMSTTTAVGTFVAYGISAIFNHFQVYQYIFLTALIFGLLMASSWFIFYPKLAAKPINISINSKKEEKVEDNAISNVSSKSIFIAILVAMGLLMLVCNLVKDGTTTWVPNILKESFGLGDSFSLTLTLVLPICGVFGTLVAVFINNKLKNYMSSSFLLMSVTTLTIGIVLIGLNFNIFALALIMFGLISLMMHGINNLLTSQAPLELKGEISGGLLGGLLNGCGYIGSTISSFGLGAIADNLGWNGVFIFLIITSGVCSLIALVFIFIIKKVKSK